MKHESITTTTDSAISAILAANTTAIYKMRLYIAGMTPNSMQAIINLRQIFQANLPDRYELDIIDLVQNPGMAADQHIVATPTLVKFFPLPMHRFVGNMSNKTMILLGLNIQPIKSRAT